MHAFLDGVISFLDIPRIVEAVTERFQARAVSIEDIRTVDNEARKQARELIQL